ncbi:protein of unknown function [Methylorubrum extorquens DM4]|uniref:Uncharacterized protein n=1 Tax=Methylorubrum extorquens (strain DSM 6343 / CIP 106787 / DM4) TaxID=661410 RepID=C7CD29_METED|nr:protein of unknown function [Methylorubrum extorquens DM4]
MARAPPRLLAEPDPGRPNARRGLTGAALPTRSIAHGAIDGFPTGSNNFSLKRGHPP